MESFLPFCCSLPEDFAKPSRHGRWQEVIKAMIEVRDAERNAGPRLRRFTWMMGVGKFFLQIVFNYITISRALIFGPITNRPTHWSQPRTHGSGDQNKTATIY